LSLANEIKSAVESAGHTIIEGHRFMFIDHGNGDIAGVDEKGEFIDLSNSVAIVPNCKTAKIFFGNNKQDVISKIKSNLPDMERKKANEKIIVYNR
jgi:hypothetical protein